MYILLDYWRKHKEAFIVKKKNRIPNVIIKVEEKENFMPALLFYLRAFRQENENQSIKIHNICIYIYVCMYV